MKQSTVDKIGWFASMMAIVMFSAYIDQIRLNMQGNTGSIVLPFATMVNCSSWIFYALLKEKKDWPIFTCNALGLIVSIVTAATAIIY